MEKELVTRLLSNIALLLKVVLAVLMLLCISLTGNELWHWHQGVPADAFDGTGFIFIAAFLVIVTVLWWSVRILQEVTFYWEHTTYVTLNLLMLLVANAPTIALVMSFSNLG